MFESVAKAVQWQKESEEAVLFETLERDLAVQVPPPTTFFYETRVVQQSAEGWHDPMERKACVALRDGMIGCERFVVSFRNDLQLARSSGARSMPSASKRTRTRYALGN